MARFLSFVVLTLFYTEMLAFDSVLYYQPDQIHISMGENVSAIVVTWSTLNDTESVVEYGINGLVLRATGSSTKFVDGGSLRATQYIHRVTLTELHPRSRYMYHCGGKMGWSALFYFDTLPKGTDWSPRLAVYGDMGNENPQSLPRLQEEAQRGKYDMFLHIGDFAYDMYENDGEIGNQFMRQIQPIAAYVPYMTAVGNHEQAYNFSHYSARFSMPKTNDNMFYSFDLGPAHFIAFSTEVYFYPEYYSTKNIAIQKEWLERNLKEATNPENRAKRPWIITYGHRPMYCSDDDGDGCPENKLTVRLQLEDLFYKYGVDLELWAHEHSYERLWPVYNNTVYNGSWNEPYTNPKAPVHITTGSAGCRENVDSFIKNPSSWSAFRSSDYGYARMQIFNNTHLYLEQVSDDRHGEVLDHIWLIKDKHGPYSPKAESYH